MTATRLRTPAERVARLDDWAAFATDAVAHADDWAMDPTGQFARRAEDSLRWSWPDASARRCRALTEVARLYVAAAPEERRAMAPALGALANATAQIVEANRPEAAPEGDLFRGRLPYRED